MNHSYVRLPYGYPPAIQEWASSFLLADESLQSAEQKRILKILTHQNVKKAAREVFRRIANSEDWPSNFTTFIGSVAEIPDRIPYRFYTPKEIADKLSDIDHLAGSLIKVISEPSGILLASNLDALADELKIFRDSIRQQLESSVDKEIGPTIGREDGTRASTNWCARQIGTLSLVHLGQLFPVFTAAVTRSLLDLRDVPTEATIRDLFKE